jgi:hypothetical protein
MGDHRNQTTPHVHHVSKITECPPANPGAPYQLEIPMLVPWPSMLDSWQNLAGSTISMPLPYSPSTVSKSLHPLEKFRKRKQPVVGAPNLRRLAPKATQGASDLESSQSCSIKSGAKSSKRDSTFTCQNKRFDCSEIQTRNGHNTTTNSTPYPYAQAHNSGPLLACGSHTPPNLFQAYDALCVVVEFCTQQPPGYLEHKEAVLLGTLKEKLNAKRHATQHGEMGRGDNTLYF